MTRPTFLRVTKQVGEVQENVTRVELDNAVSAGISWGQIGAEMVPIFEEQIARVERNYTLEQWAKLPRMEKALIIAIRRVDNASKNLQAEAEIAKAKRDAKKSQ